MDKNSMLLVVAALLSVLWSYVRHASETKASDAIVKVPAPIYTVGVQVNHHGLSGFAASRAAFGNRDSMADACAKLIAQIKAEG